MKAMLEQSQRRYEFKTADSACERAEVNQLLYRTFVLEIPRYDDPGTDSLVDKFDHCNIYFVAIHDGCVCGTMAVHDGPIFSAASAIANPSVLAQLSRPLLEARIFAVDSNHRSGVVFAGLACSVHQYAISNGYAHILISGLERRQDMYERMGFRSLGPPVVRGNDRFVPMSLDLATVPTQVKKDLKRWSTIL
nr:hypothetical protein [Novipirellula artificiosorum]